ncbi:MAG TPA: hypothetical protein V6C57_16785 [Coleofasciculaceae cyanobacterium]
MQPNNEEIIKICAETQDYMRTALIKLLVAGVKLGMLHSFIEAAESADRLSHLGDSSSFAREMSSPPDFYAELAHWQSRALKAEEELQRRNSLDKDVEKQVQELLKEEHEQQ